LHKQHRNIVIDRPGEPIGRTQIGNIFFRVGAAVHGEACPADAPAELCRLQVVDRVGHGIEHRVVKLLTILANQGPGGVIKVVHHSQVVANDRPAVCVGGGQGNRFAGQPVLRRDCVGDAQRCFAIDADQVECDEHMPAARGVFEDECLGPEVGQGALGRPVPASVARHPHQLRRRDAAASHTGPPARGVVCRVGGGAPAVADDGDTHRR
jgi:hypothetical protein